MGNICSRSANKPDDPFARPGRPLGSSNPPGNKQSSAPVPSKTNFASPGRALGGEETGQSGSEADVKAKAAVAAQVCDSSSGGKGGKLCTVLMVPTLAETSRNADAWKRQTRLEVSGAKGADPEPDTRRGQSR